MLPSVNFSKSQVIKKRRLRQIISAIFAQFGPPLSRIILSLVVVRVYSKEFWGHYVQYLLVVSFALTIINWGSRDFLLRQYSQEPSRISSILNASILGKFLISFFVLIALSLLPLGELNRLIIVIWVVGQLGWQFFDALNVYRRLFLAVTIIELGLVVVAISVLMLFPLSLSSFLLLMVLMEFLKFGIYCWIHLPYFSFQAFQIKESYAFLRQCFPFFLLILVSALAARGELYLVALLKDRTALAQYQVLSNFLQSSHLLAMAIFLPFIKNIFRLKTEAIQSLERNFILFGFVLMPFLIGGIYLILYYGYQFRFSSWTYLLVYFILWSFYFYAIRIQVFFKQDKVNRVTLFMSVMGFFNVLLGLLLIPIHGILGALWAALLSNILGVICFRSVRIE